MSRSHSVYLVALICAIPVPLTAQAQEWSQWRGPARTGVVVEVSVTTWPDTLTVDWETAVDPGLSSPVVSGGRVVLFGREGERETLAAYAFETGRELWRQAYDAPFVPNPQATSPRYFPRTGGRGPFATPLVHNGRIYTLGVSRILHRVSAENGTIAWRKHFYPAVVPEKLEYECPPCGCGQDGKTFSSEGTCPDCGMRYGAKGLETTATRGAGNYYGAAASPLVAEGKLVINVGNNKECAVIALDPDSGEELWRWTGPPQSSSSPVVAEIAGVTQVVVLTRENLAGLDLQSGKPLWTHALSSNAQIVTPIVHENLVLFSAYRSPSTALRITEENGVWRAAEAWSNPAVSLYTSTPVLIDDVIYGLSYTMRGQFFAANFKTGEVLWTSEGRQAQGAAVLGTMGSILALKSDGELLVFAQDGSSFNPVKTYFVASEPTWAHPALLGNTLLVRTSNQLKRFRLN